MTTTQRVAADLAPTGVLRASVNLGNPVLAQGTPENPSGITVDLAREIGARLGVGVELLCFDAARKSFEAMADGRADLCFLAVDPAREAEVAFTAPYVVIEGVYAVPRDSALTTAEEVDAPGVRIGVKKGPPTTCSCPGPSPTRPSCAGTRASTSSAPRAWRRARASGSP